MSAVQSFATPRVGLARPAAASRPAPSAARLSVRAKASTQQAPVKVGGPRVRDGFSGTGRRERAFPHRE